MRWIVCFGLLACAHSRPRAPSPITLTYLGVAGWTISDGRRTIVVDPYVSRPAEPDHPVSDPHAVAARAPRAADAILVGHGHFDHALDVPPIARATGAIVLGAADVATKLRDAGIADAKIREVKGGEDYELDGFSVRVVPSLHSVIGAAGSIATLAYLVRLAGRQILVFDTANFIEREVAGLRPDVAIIATGNRAAIHDYACRLVRALGEPPIVVPTHFDDWHGPADAPLSAENRADLDAFAAELARCAPRTRVVVPTAFVPLPVP
jgi:L-ascorbate metabolism protein UlaG (beta-lactamase superfamily)